MIKLVDKEKGELILIVDDDGNVIEIKDKKEKENKENDD